MQICAELVQQLGEPVLYQMPEVRKGDLRLKAGRKERRCGEEEQRDAAQDDRDYHPDGRGDAFRPDQLRRTRGQCEHQIAFVAQQVFVKSVNHVRECQHIDREHRKDIDGHQYAERGGDRQGNKNRICQREQQEDAECRKENPTGGFEFIANQLAQHANTSRNSASTDFPYSERMSSTDLCSVI